MPNYLGMGRSFVWGEALNGFHPMNEELNPMFRVESIDSNASSFVKTKVHNYKDILDAFK
jgi:hypothetical protein